MHSGGIGMTCFIRPRSLSSFNRRAFLPVCSSWVLNIHLMVDQCASEFCVFSSVDSLCISTISSFRTHSRGRPGFLDWFIELRLLDLRFKDYRPKYFLTWKLSTGLEILRHRDSRICSLTFESQNKDFCI